MRKNFKFKFPRNWIKNFIRPEINMIDWISNNFRKLKKSPVQKRYSEYLSGNSTYKSSKSYPKTIQRPSMNLSIVIFSGNNEYCHVLSSNAYFNFLVYRKKIDFCKDRLYGTNSIPDNNYYFHLNWIWKSSTNRLNSGIFGLLNS